MQQDKASMGHSLDRRLLLVVLAPALLKLFFLRADQLFEVHTMALEWLASGQFRHHYMGSWDHAFQFPVYTAIVAGIYSLGAGPPGVLVFQVVCGTLTAWLAHGTARRLLDGKPYAERVALGSALLTGLSPFLAYYQARMVHPFAWDMLLATSLLRASIQAQPKRPTTVLGLFALAGLVLLNRPTLVVFLLPFLHREWKWLIAPRNAAWKAGLLALALVPIAAWTVRNRIVCDRWQLTSLSDQMTWMGLQERTEGAGHLEDGTDYHALLTLDELQHLAVMDPADRSRFFRGKWKAATQSDPALRWRMLAVKLKNFWSFRGHDAHHTGVGAWAAEAFKGYALVVLALVVVALVRGPREVHIVLLCVLLLSILQCWFYFETRHRLVVEPLLLLVALSAVAGIMDRMRGRPNVENDLGEDYFRPVNLHTMNRTMPLVVSIGLLLTACVPKKKYAEIQASNETLRNKLEECNRGLSERTGQNAVLEARLTELQNKNEHLKDQVAQLNNTNAALLNNVDRMATLSAKEAANMEKSLEQIREQDLRIRSLQDALTKKDSVTLALVVSLKSSLGNLNDTDVVVNVEKSVVFISLSDKMVFSSGSTTISPRASEVLAKVATVVNSKPDMEVLVEGHTDNIPVSKECIKDNWDLSVQRAVAITRILQKDHGVDPARITAGGRGEYVPLVANDSPENRSTNRRTRIVILPKMDQFFGMIEQGLKQAGDMGTK